MPRKKSSEEVAKAKLVSYVYRWWPASNLNVHPAERATKPTSGEFCNECRAKAKR